VVTLEQAATQLGCDEVRLQHRAFNEQAHRFSEALGYRTDVVTMARRPRGGPLDPTDEKVSLA
jgi:RimJ/RimL family protein N-acetyltransferase